MTVLGPSDIQALIDAGVIALEKTTSGYVTKGKQPGQNWTTGLSDIAKARAAVGNLVLPPSVPPTPPPTVVYGARTLPQGPFTDRTNALIYRMGADGSGTFGTVTKQHIHDTPDYGLALMQWDPPTAAPKGGAWAVSDVGTTNIGHTPPTSDGKAEAGVWLAVPANTQRLQGHGTCMGFWIGAQHTDSTHTDWTAAIPNADGTLGKLPAHGVYIEHAARRIKIQYATIKATAHGITAEWWYKDPANAAIEDLEYPTLPTGEAGSLYVEICNCHIEADEVGIFLDAGCGGYHIHDNYIDAPVGINHDANLINSNFPNVIEWDTLTFSSRCTQHEVINQNPIGV